MGSFLSYLRDKRKEGIEVRKKYKEALCLSDLAPGGGSYVFVNVASEEIDNTLALTHSQKNGESSVVLGKFKSGRVSDQTFKIEPCSDYREDCVVSCHGNKEPKLQWVVGKDAHLEMNAYPAAEKERLGPHEKKWRFRIEEISPPGSKMYRVVSMHDDLDGIDCLALKERKTSEVPELVFNRRKDDDQSQLWYLISR